MSDRPPAIKGKNLPFSEDTLFSLYPGRFTGAFSWILK
jgi:hypothetical protein